MSNYTGKCSGYEDDGSGSYLCECDHVVDEHESEWPRKCQFCDYEEAE